MEQSSSAEYGRAMKRRTLALALVLVGVGAGCTAPESKPAISKVESDAPTDQPTAKAIYTYFSDDKDAFFAVEISNPADRTRAGVKTLWKALDADGVIVGSLEAAQPPIPPGKSIIYVGGASYLDGNAKEFSVTIADAGHLVMWPPTLRTTVSDASFKRAEHDFWSGAQTYIASAVVTAQGDMAGKDVEVSFVFRDKRDAIVGVGFVNKSDTVPERLAKGDKVRVVDDSAVVDGGTPVRVEAFAF